MSKNSLYWHYEKVTAMRRIIMKYLLWILVLGFGGQSMGMILVGTSGGQYLPKSVVRVYPEDLVKKPWSVTVKVSEHETAKQYYYHADSCPDELTYVVIDGDRGEDIGWVEGQCQQVIEPFRPTIIRLATMQDVARDRQNQIEASRILRVLGDWRTQVPHWMTEESIRALGRMSFSGARMQLDGQKITLYYISDGRVQFSALVQDLFHACFRNSSVRIWMQNV